MAVPSVHSTMSTGDASLEGGGLDSGMMIGVAGRAPEGGDARPTGVEGSAAWAYPPPPKLDAGRRGNGKMCRGPSGLEPCFVKKMTGS